MTTLIIHWFVFSILLFGGYKFLLSKGTHYTFNRVFLLTLLPNAFLFSIIKLPLSDFELLRQTLPPITFADTFYVKKTTSPQIFNLIGALYISGVMIFFIQFLVQFIQLRKFIHNQKSERDGKYVIRHVSESSAPGSFFNTIILPVSIKGNKRQIVMLHEKAHVDLHHSYDVLYLRFAKVFFYINPVLWLVDRELNKIHENQADQKVLSHIPVSVYKSFLLEASLQSYHSKLIKTFSGNQLKFRFYMMNKSKSGRWAAWKAVLIIPVLIIVLTAFSLPGKKLPVFNSEMSLTFSDQIIYPEFVGGQSALTNYIIDNLKYPETSKLKKEEGKVYVMFNVQIDGSITDVNVKKGVSDALDQEAVRVVKNMPNWKPGSKDGKPAVFEMTLPIQFALQ